ncbi:PaaI family thioesterase [Cytobacillus purgationiresistens]|uniref:Uncharacterized protein (TIGR00369 family) n=1 Tax=Cytobacillus purgationiresistens TaxID=863449 RepID=A0ABU0AF65_9BACI|nr:PaaI family thioesterase [Cytobacillus purgationiresistens]MDQ0269670.1 uncharacterized protein (TIGR00369 family) [Cytobacillus purgationiresistens]
MEVTSDYLQWLTNEFEDSPFWKLLGITMDRLEPGEAVIKMPVKESLLNSNQVMHGGAIASILDSIIGVVIRSSRDVKVATVSLTTQFIAPVKEGALYAEAKTINKGNRIQYVESKVFNDKGEIVGTALGTFAIIKK